MNKDSKNIQKKVEKAYKLLAQSLKISNNQAKELIDKGVVFIGNQKIKIARSEVPIKSKFRVIEIEEPKIIFEDENLIAINKPPYLSSEEIEKRYSNYKLIHRLDKETSGVLLLAKNEEILKKCINEFKKGAVYKEYIAWIEGILPEPITINKPISTKKGQIAKSRVNKNGKEAITYIEPIEIEGKKTKIKVVIKTGRTHQIRVHLQSIQRPIIGDTFYGGREAKRVMLHAHIIELLGYKIVSPEPKWEF